MRRLAAAGTLTALTWLLVALPAAATEGQAATEEVSWDGMVYALVLGVIVGIAVTVTAAGEPLVSDPDEAGSAGADEH